MDANGLQRILSATPREIRLLDRHLMNGDAYAFLLHGGPRFAPSSISAWLRPPDPSYEMRLERPIEYRGDDAQLVRLATEGFHQEATLEEMVGFIRRYFGAAAGDGRAGSADGRSIARRPGPGPVRPSESERTISALPSAAEVTDLAEARRQLADREVSRRLLVDRERLAARLKRRIHGQDEVLDLLTDRVTLELAKRDRRKPLSFFFCGRSGVGKTETAIVLAEALDFPECDVRYTLVRYNMHEYQERHFASRFVGAPPSYVGYGDTPPLLQEIERNPFLVVLLDEIEKAHPDILKTLMALIDTGELSCPAGGDGTVVGDFRRCVLVFTSNVRLPGLERDGNADVDQASVAFQLRARNELVRQHMPPEIAGRIQTFLLFHDLSAEQLLPIVADKIQRCAANYGVAVSRISPLLLTELAQQAISSSFGVRIVEMVVERKIAAGLVGLLREHPQLEKVEITLADGQVIVLPDRTEAERQNSSLASE